MKTASAKAVLPIVWAMVLGGIVHAQIIIEIPESFKYYSILYGDEDEISEEEKQEAIELAKKNILKALRGDMEIRDDSEVWYEIQTVKDLLVECIYVTSYYPEDYYAEVRDDNGIMILSFYGGFGRRTVCSEHFVDEECTTKQYYLHLHLKGSKEPIVHKINLLYWIPEQAK